MIIEDEEEEEFRTIQKIVYEWEQLNTQMPIWTLRYDAG